MSTRVISVTSNNTAATQDSSLLGGTVALNNTGDLVVFSSLASLTDNDINGLSDIYLFNRNTGTLTNLTIRRFNGTLSTGLSSDPSISGNGQKVVFESDERSFSNVTGNAIRNIYIADNLTGTPPTFTLITNGFTNNSFNSSISNDGNWVVFETEQPQSGGVDATDLDIILHSRVTGTNTWVSQVTGGGGNVAAASLNASVSGDGRFVVFQSDGNESTFIPGVTGNNLTPDVFLFDKNNLSLRLVSHRDANPTQAGNGSSLNAALSSDGRFVVYQSNASNLILGDNNATSDIFVYEISTGLNTRINLRPGGSQTTASSSSPSISTDGNSITFTSSDIELVSNDNNNQSDIFLWKRATGAISLVSKDSSGDIGNAASINSAISPDGSKAAFQSLANDLAQPVQAGISNVFLNDQLTEGGNPNPNPNDPLTATVYRFYNAQSKGHFFTASQSERDTVLANPQWGYTYEDGFGFKASTNPGQNLLEVFRFYNAQAKGHFFTTSTQERDTVLANPQWGYTYEQGFGFYAYGIDANLGSDVYRFYNSQSKGHFFTINPSERDTVLANPQWGYTYEPGLGFEAKP